MYNETQNLFTVTPFVEEFPKRDIGGFTGHLSYSKDADSAMSGLDEPENEHVQIPDSPIRYNSSPESEMVEPRDIQANTGTTKSKIRAPKTQSRATPGVQPRKILTKDNARTSPKVDNNSPPPTTINPDSVFWVKGEYTNPKMSAAKHYPNDFASDPRKLEFINIMDLPECDDSTRA